MKLTKVSFDFMGIVKVIIAIIAFIKTYGTPLFWVMLFLAIQSAEAKFTWEK